MLGWLLVQPCFPMWSTRPFAMPRGRLPAYTLMFMALTTGGRVSPGALPGKGESPGQTP